jgi:hypothetical protein
MRNAGLYGAGLDGVDLRSAGLRGTRGLTTEQLVKAKTDDEMKPPRGILLPTAQDRAIAAPQADHAEAMVEFIDTQKFGNEALYEGMGGVLE